MILDEDTDATKRLFLISAGNVSTWEVDHLARSDVEPVEDPAQAWNAVTVGAFTERVVLDPAEANFAGYAPVAPEGELSPFSRTSVAFSREWPAKPEILLEGGNLACSPDESWIDHPYAFQLLTTRAAIGSARLLTVTRETSAATAQAGFIASSILADYPDLWPETVRALLVHSAEWTPAMWDRFRREARRAPRDALRRRYGMGVADLRRALRSASDALTLVAEDVIHPFDGEGRMREMNVHLLPWPAEVLADLGGEEVRLRVTLSYFIQPNPGRRGWGGRYTYASHSLRFEVRRPTESTVDFRQRVNFLARSEEERRRTSADASEWLFGPDLRATGSLHSDIWTGTAADLAQRGAVAVFPVSGWWRERPSRDRSDRGVRYALVISIETPGLDVDVWTPVAEQLGIPIEVET